MLLTNDGGQQDRGTGLMRRALIDAGLQVFTVTPARPCSQRGDCGAQALPDTIECIGDDSENPIFTIDGSPKQCVQVALGMDLAGPVSVVVAGISEAAPSVWPAARSATIDAATEGALLGYPSVAISQISREGHALARDSGSDDLNWSAVIGAEWAAWLVASPPPMRSVLNVSVPAILRDRTLKLAHSQSDRLGTAAVASGHVCIAPMNLAGGMGSTVRLFDWARKSLATIGERIGAPDGRCLAGCCV